MPRIRGPGGVALGGLFPCRSAGSVRTTDMGNMKCLACGHDNKAGEETCSACSAPLNLKVCNVCEAINVEDAARCPNCGAAETSLPSAWVSSGEPRSHGRLRVVALWIVPVLALAGFAAYYSSSGVPQAQALQIIEPKIAPQPPGGEASKVIPQVTHTRVGDSAAATGGATLPASSGNDQ